MKDISKVLNEIKGALEQAATTLKTVQDDYTKDPKKFDSKKGAADAEAARLKIGSCLDLLAEINPEQSAMEDDVDFDADTSYFQADDKPDTAFLLKKYIPRVELLLKETEDLCKPTTQKLEFREYYAINVKLAKMLSMMLDIEFGIGLIHAPSTLKPVKPAPKKTPAVAKATKKADDSKKDDDSKKA